MMNLCPECQPKVDALERAIRHTIDGRTKEVEYDRCFFALPDARRVIWNYKDYCRRYHGAKIEMFTSYHLSLDELRDAIVLWVRERQGIAVEPKDVSFKRVSENKLELMHVVVEYGFQGDVDVSRESPSCWRCGTING